MSALLAATLAAAAVTGTFNVSDRSELRLRTEPNGDSTRYVADVETSPLAVLRVFSRRAEITLSYSPRYTIRQIDLSPPIGEILQRAGVAIAFRDRRTFVQIGQDAAYGRTSFATLSLGQTSTSAPPPGAPPVERLPLLQTIFYASSRTYFSAAWVASRSVRGLLYLDYSFSGGTDATSRTILPWVTSPRGELSLEVRIDRSDTLVSTLRAARVTFGSTPILPSIDLDLFEQLEGLRHRFGLSTEATLSIGVGESRSHVTSDTQSAPAPWKIAPVVEAMLRHVLAPDHIEARIYARFAHVVDRLTGNLDYQGQGSLVALWTPDSPRHGIRVRTLLGIAESIQQSHDRALSVFILEAALGYRTSPHVLVELGARTISQRLSGTDPGPRFYLGFIAATFSAETIRF